ncbi:nuclear transport factor 2 family protein [Starkeya sp. 3C]|uniref:Nuclear transport factor 2 family protein n=1 Tax=Ancylobacter moscoviensis TaxID=2597768 RepID=A0ABY3DPM5_9HYPH|nr:nuclear transport factor 2 family protein [Ancylobacter moscoviensis]TSJ60587.1 nuclear transport factor 2 family protein [Ancylobacter moscoviensis]
MSEAASAAEDPAGDLAGVEAAERRLRDAALHGDVAALDALLADDLIFVDQTGRFLSKADDLELHRSGALTLDTLRFSDYRLRALAPGLVLAVLRADAAGRAAGEAFTVALRFSRLWRREPTGWRVASAHSTAIS